MVAWTKSGEGNISFVANGVQYYVNADHDRYTDVLNGLRNGASENDLENMVQQRTAVEKYLQESSENQPGDSVFVRQGHVIYRDEAGNEEECSGTFVDRLLGFMNENLPVLPLRNFIRKRMRNPSYVAGEELDDFLDHKSLPICEDGDFLAYKAVTHDYKDKYTNSKDNSIGQTVSEPRRKVDDNRENGCSKGLHAGTLDYVNSFGWFRKDEDGNPLENSDRAIIVKINPEHVVSVPKDCECQKLRTCEYYVLKDFEGELNYQLADEDGNEWEDDEYDDWYDDASDIDLEDESDDDYNPHAGYYF